MFKSLVVSDLTYRLMRSAPKDVTPVTSDNERIAAASELTVEHQTIHDFVGKFPSKDGNEWVKLPAELELTRITLEIPHHLKSLGTYDLNRMKYNELNASVLKLHGVDHYLPIIRMWLIENGYVTDEDNLFDLLMLGSALSKCPISVRHDISANNLVNCVERSIRGTTANGEYSVYLTKIQFDFLHYAKQADLKAASLVFDDDPEYSQPITWYDGLKVRVVCNRKFNLSLSDLYEVSSPQDSNSDHSKGKKEKNKDKNSKDKGVTSKDGMDAETQALFERPLSSFLLPM